MGTVPAPNIVQAAGEIAATPQNRLAEYARMAQLQQQTQLTEQATQAQKLENQKQQMQLSDAQAMTKAMQAWDGSDPDALPELMKKNGISGPGYMQAQQSLLDRKTKVAQLDKDQLDNLTKHHDAALGAIDAAKQVPDEQLPQHITDTVQQLQTAGHLTQAEANNILQHSQSMPAAQFRPWLDIYEKGLLGEKALADQQIKDRETTAKEKEANAKAQTAQTTADRLAAEQPGGSLQTVDRAELDAYKKNPRVDAGVPLDKRDAATFAAWKAKLSPQAQLTVAQQAGGGMTKEALDQAAEVYHLTGKLPPGGRGAAGIAQGRMIMNRSAELYPGSITEDSAEYAANKESLKKLQTQFDAVSGFENTAGKNLDLFLKQAKKVIDFGSPLINMPLRVAAQKAGSGDQAAFSTARTTALTEIAKVLNSPTGAGVLSDSARHEVEGLIGPDATLKQIYQAADILKQDMANRHQSYSDQIADIKKRLPGKKAGSDSTGFSVKVGDKTYSFNDQKSLDAFKAEAEIQ